MDNIKKLEQANNNIALLIHKYISLKASQRSQYCPHGDCIFKDGEDFSCSECQKAYWNKEEQKMLKDYKVE